MGLEKTRLLYSIASQNRRRQLDCRATGRHRMMSKRDRLDSYRWRAAERETMFRVVARVARHPSFVAGHSMLSLRRMQCNHLTHSGRSVCCGASRSWSDGRRFGGRIRGLRPTQRRESTSSLSAQSIESLKPNNSKDGGFLPIERPSKRCRQMTHESRAASVYSDRRVSDPHA